MKIYFEDGRLINTKYLPEKPDYIIDATEGVTACLNSLCNLHMNKPDAIVYTNFILAMSNQYAWNEKLKVPEIYIRDNEHGCFTNITNFTHKELREAHNLARMYVAGAFETLVNKNEA